MELLLSVYKGNLYLSHTNLVSQRLNQRKGLNNDESMKPDKNQGVEALNRFLKVFSVLSLAV
jgi:hypothetical protein